ncbi:MAG TPA: NRDE family protein [Gemmatimonadales bacterium]|nr:NRDE family protein [Gemmatimonadales bacterium]
MCTLSWLPVHGGYGLFFNRDESRLRGPEVPAGVHRWDSVALVAPLDSDQGGTWIAANEFGVTVAVLNRYGPEMVRTVAQTSRGQLVRSLATSPSPELVRRRLRSSMLSEYQPFTIATTAPDSPVYLLAWDGQSLDDRSVELPGLVAISSGFSPEAEAARRAALSQIQAGGALTTEVLEAFHRSHLPVRGPLSPCMHRPEAETRSFCRVDVTHDAVEIRHVLGPPCVTTEFVRSSVARSREPSPLSR